jgi:hypothetical protein
VITSPAVSGLEIGPSGIFRGVVLSEYVGDVVWLCSDAEVALALANSLVRILFFASAWRRRRSSFSTFGGPQLGFVGIIASDFSFLARSTGL